MDPDQVILFNAWLCVTIYPVNYKFITARILSRAAEGPAL